MPCHSHLFSPTHIGFLNIKKFNFKILTKIDDNLISDMFQLWGEFGNYVTLVGSSKLETRKLQKIGGQMPIIHE